MGRPVSFFDTNILVDVLRGFPSAAAELKRHGPHRISRITWTEILAGAHDDNEARILEGFLDQFAVVELNESIARRAAALRRSSRMKLPDALIYAAALESGEALVTRNTKDFSPTLPGIRVPYRA